VTDTAGRLDISFNAVGIPDATILGVPLVELDLERFSLPITAYTRSYFLTARLAARRMVANRSGVIMTVTAIPLADRHPVAGRLPSGAGGQGGPNPGPVGRAGPQGIRVVGLRPNGLPETDSLREAFEVRAKALGVTWEQWQQQLAGRSHPWRGSTLGELAEVAAFVASDRAGGMTGTTVNLTMGSLDD
jgi:hypothetical protein